jgi:hypothetical protein
MKNTEKMTDNLSVVLKDYQKPEIEIIDLREDVLSASVDPWVDDNQNTWH